MKSSGAQVAPHGLGASERTVAAPPASEIRFSLASPKKPRESPLGEKNGVLPPAVSGTGVILPVPMSRMQICVMAPDRDTYARREPSGENASAGRSWPDETSPGGASGRSPG